MIFGSNLVQLLWVKTEYLPFRQYRNWDYLSCHLESAWCQRHWGLAELEKCNSCLGWEAEPHKVHHRNPGKDLMVIDVRLQRFQMKKPPSPVPWSVYTDQPPSCKCTCSEDTQICDIRKLNTIGFVREIKIFEPKVGVARCEVLL